MNWKTFSLITYLFFDVVVSSNCYLEGYNLPCCNKVPYDGFSTGYYDVNFNKENFHDTYFEKKNQSNPFIYMNAIPKSLNITNPNSKVLIASYNPLSEEDYLDHFKDFINGRKNPSNPLVCVDRSSLCKYNFDNYGIRCCTGNPKVLYHDKYGDWGKEYNEWCLMLYDNNYSQFLPENIERTYDFEDPVKPCDGSLSYGYDLFFPMAYSTCGAISPKVPDIIDVDEIGMWGIHYDRNEKKINWCLYNPYDTSSYLWRKDSIYNTTDKCFGITNGYNCCHNNFNVYYTNYLGDWSFEYNNWCLIYKDQEEKYQYIKGKSNESDDTVYEVGAINKFNNMKNPYTDYISHKYGGMILYEDYDPVKDEFMIDVVPVAGGYYGRPNIFYMDLKEFYDVLDYEQVDCSFSFQIKKANSTTSEIYVATNVNDKNMSYDDHSQLIRSVAGFIRIGDVFKLDVTNEYQTFTFNKQCNKGVYLLFDDQKK